MYITDLDSPITILIAEDNHLYKKVIIDFLQEDSNFKIVGEAKDGKTAVKLADELNPDLIIMDIGLPVMTGIEAIKKIKETNPSIKFVVFTSHHNQDEAIKALEAGASAYVNKDIDITYMKMIIETVNQGAVWLAPSIGSVILKAAIAGRLK